MAMKRELEQVYSSFSHALGLYVNCTESDGVLSKVSLTSRPLSAESHSSGSSAIVDFLDRGRDTLTDLPVTMTGTPFQKLVWRRLRTVRPGNVVTYGDLARMAGAKGAARAVGGAVARNNLLIVVPCHRVVSVSGIGGFSAFGGMRTKLKLLELEKRYFGSNQNPDWR